MAKEEILLKLSMLEQKSEEIKQQIEAVESQINELESLKMSLKKIDKSKGKEMLASLGRGIFIKTEIKDEKLFVNVGSKTLIKKTPSETIEIIDAQIKEMEEIKINLLRAIEQINVSLNEIFEEARKSSST